MGDASGVGPEIILKSFKEGTISNEIVYGDTSILRAGDAYLKTNVPINTVTESCGPKEGHLNVRDFGLLTRDDWQPGIINVNAGAAAYEYICQATRDALAGELSAMVTMPVNKEAIQLQQHGFTGHTDLIAQLCGANDAVMMLATQEVAVSHVSAHVSLKEAIERVKQQRVARVISLTHDSLRKFIDQPRIAVCGLNPHASENGLFGCEETEEIIPAIHRAREAGIAASGPYPADTVFRQAIHQNAFDAVVCMYHDQGHGPMKLHAFERGVNVTLGLPIIRTSVDHGTAFDIAWKGQAFTDSLTHALTYARRLVDLDDQETGRETKQR